MTGLLPICFAEIAMRKESVKNTLSFFVCWLCFACRFIPWGCPSLPSHPLSWELSQRESLFYGFVVKAFPFTERNRPRSSEGERAKRRKLFRIDTKTPPPQRERFWKITDQAHHIPSVPSKTITSCKKRTALVSPSEMPIKESSCSMLIT